MPDQLLSFQIVNSAHFYSCFILYSFKLGIEIFIIKFAFFYLDIVCMYTIIFAGCLRVYDFFIAKSVSVIYVLFFKGRNWIFALTKAKLQNICFSAPYTPCIDNTWNTVTFQFICYRCIKECFIKTVELRTCWGKITIRDDTEDSLKGTKSINKISKSWESLP